MAQTFDIRFARTAGLAAMLEVPVNSFRWKGGGLLRIDPHGISIGLKRGLFALLGGKRVQRIPTANLRAVYREGDALRVEFQSADSARIVLPFWANDRDSAAQIVRLLPTRQSVEIEEATHFAKPRADWRILLSLGVALAALVAGAWAVYQRTQASVAAASAAPAKDRVEARGPVPASTGDSSVLQVEAPAPPVSSRKSGARVEAPAFPLNASRLPLETRRASPESASASAPSRTQEVPKSPLPATTNPDTAVPARHLLPVTPEGVIPFVPGMPAYEAARRQVDLFLAESDTLRGYYLDVRYDANDQRFSKIESLWWKVTARVSNSPDLQDPALKPLQEIELAISRAWRRAFVFYADPALLASADAEVEFAEMLEARARQLVD